MNAAVITGLFEGLSEESQISALDYLRYLAERDGRRKADKARRIFEKVDTLLDGDTGWESEEEMIADLAEFRRKNEGL